MLAAARSKAFDRTTLAFAVVLIAATALRIWALRLAPVSLDHDEAAFWAWSRTPAWGYLNAPPMVAWVIAATTRLFGDAEWAVRLGAPLAQGATALALYALGRNVYGAWIGFWTGIAWLVTPGVWFSSNIISSDVLLLPLWSLALVAMWRMVQTRSMIWAVVLGVAVGAGLNAAYAMLYLPLCALVATRWSQPVREALKGGRGIVALLAALALFAPNLIWNAQHSFESTQQALANLNINITNLFNVSKIVEFTTGQALLIGPITFVVLLGLLARASGRAAGLTDEDRFLLAFTLPPLALMILFAIIARADANWAVTAYPAAIAWITGSLITNVNGRRVFAAALISNAVIGGIIAFQFFHPSSAGVMRGIRDSAGWQQTARTIATRAAPLRGERPFDAVAVDDADAYYRLNFYWGRERALLRDLPPLQLWMLRGPQEPAPDGAQSLTHGARVLIVHATQSLIPFVAGDFTTFRTVEHVNVSSGGRVNRTLDLSVGEGFSPARRDAAFNERLNNRHDQATP